jgi:hypothetical protein
MSECPRCGGEMREGLAFVSISAPSGGSSFGGGGGMFPTPGMNIPGGESTRSGRVKWREKTGKEKGWIFKSEEEKTLDIRGRRCLECGYIDFYVEE